LTPAIRAMTVLLTLSLLVARVRANDEHAAVPLDHATSLAHRLNGRSNFHLCSPVTDKDTAQLGCAAGGSIVAKPV
jgi:hypothetical protein